MARSIYRTEKPLTEKQIEANYTARYNATKLINGWAIFGSGKPLATVLIKGSGSGGTTSCFLHISGIPLVVGKASGGGYNKSDAAFEDAAYMLTRLNLASHGVGTAAGNRLYSDVVNHCLNIGGTTWDNILYRKGYIVFQVA